MRAGIPRWVAAALVFGRGGTASRSRRSLPVILLSLPVLLLLGGAVRPAAAVTCTLDLVPGATLLLPYFEVDLGDPNGLTTLFSINNSSPGAVLTHVVIWSDLGVPVLEFSVYLTGYDVQTINLRDIVIYGNLPQTASAGQDPTDTISPQGPLSLDINFPSCQGVLPPPPLPPAFTQHLQLALTGRPSPVLQNLCAGQNLGDNVARGYITVDTVNNCTLRIPGDSGYFGNDATADATDQNVLWGNWYIVNVPQSYVLGSTMVSLEADALDPSTSTTGRYTFYGRYVGWSAVDHREPLASTFAAQFFSGGPLFPAGSDLIVWRDPKTDQQAFPCPATATVTPSWYPLGQEGMVIFDESEHPLVPQTYPFSPAPSTVFNPFPAVAQMIPVGSANLPVPFLVGWFYLDLNSGSLFGAPAPTDATAAQGYVLSAHLANGHAVAVDAFRLDSTCSPSHSPP